MVIFPLRDDSSFCCGPGNSSTDKCIQETRGSFNPIRIDAGRAIFDRPSGSTSSTGSQTVTATVSSAPTSTVASDLALVTVTSIAAPSTTAATSSNPTTCPTSPSSSKEPIVVGVGVGVPLGLALLGAAALIWRQRSRELNARRAASDWEKKYKVLREMKRGEWTGGVERQMQETENGFWSPQELDGRAVHKVATSTR